VSNKPKKKILSVVYDRNKDEGKTWQTLLTKDTNQERGSGLKQKLQNIKHAALQLKYTYIIHTIMHYFSFPKSNPIQSKPTHGP
jgi:hypothetical protein